MNYIEILNAFFQWLETNPLSLKAQLIYFHMLNLFNKSGWKEWIQVDNQRMMAMVRISNEKTFVTVRDELLKNKLFEFRKGKKSSPNRYKICTCNFVPKNYSINYSKSDSENYSINYSENYQQIKTKQNNKESKEGKKSENRLTFDQLINGYTHNEELRQILKKHLITRKQNNSLNNEAIILGFKNLNTLTNSITTKEDKDKQKIKIVEQAIASGTSAFLPIRDKKKEEKKKEYKNEYSNGELDSLYDN